MFMQLFPIILFLMFLLAGVPIAFALLLPPLIGLLVAGDFLSLQILVQRLFSGVDDFILLALPFFILAGDLMDHGKLTTRLVKFSGVLVGRLRGGLGISNVVASMFFGGITGSAVADTSAIGSVLIPAMQQDGYDADFSCAVTASSSVIGPIIPPSCQMVVYAVTVGVSTGGLFAAGMIPGIFVGFALMFVTYIISVKRRYPKREEPVTSLEFWTEFWRAISVLLMPIIILGGLFSGVFTATEAAVVAAGYGMVLTVIIMRNIKIRDIPGILVHSMVTSGFVLLLIASARVFLYYLTIYDVPHNISNFIVSVSGGRPMVFLLIVNIVLIVLGMMVESGALIIILGPILAPVAETLGIDPLHFGIIFCMNTAIGLATPPVGSCLFVSSALTGVSLDRISRAVIPFIIAEILVLLAVTYLPGVAMFMPGVLGYR
jgi:C4-dicarboxylate transporter DctM subunit